MFVLWLSVVSLAVFAACSSENDIFPSADTSTDTDEVELPNPIAIAADPANDQIIVVNSNVDFFVDQGTLTTIDVDASNPNAPKLKATKVITTPNFGGEIAFDGTSAFIPFRESLDDSDNDQVKKFTIGAGTITPSATGTTSINPFGITLSNSSVLVVSDDKLKILNKSLDSIDTVDLTISDDEGIDDADSSDVESVAVDPATNLAFITNRGGKMFIVDLDNKSLTHVIDGPRNTRGVASDGNFIYAVDGNSPALWVFDPADVSAASNPPVEIDDSQILVAVIDLGSDPNGIAIDAANGRAYIANSNDQNISVIDLNLLEEIDRISLKEEDTIFEDAEEPFGVAVGTFNGTSFVFVANFHSNTISVINAETLKVVGSFP